MASVSDIVRHASLHPGTPSARRPRYGVAWWAWLFQRVTGVLLVGYLLIHIGIISSVQLGANTFDSVLGFVQLPVFAFLDLVLIAIVIFHGANGLRVILVEAGIGARRQAAMAWGALAITVAGTAFATVAGWTLLFG